MKKRILCFVLTFALVAQMCVTTTLAAATLESGTCGDDLTWTVDSDYVLTISGTGAMYDFSNFAMFCDVPWQGYLWSITGVVIESGVTSIGTYAFMNCANMTSVSIPDTVTSIGDYAFYDCHALASATIPSSVKTIGVQAFATGDVSHAGLQTIVFEGDAPQIGEDAFFNTVVTAYYPEGNTTWTSDVVKDYGGSLTWEAGNGEDSGSGAVTWSLENGILTISGTGTMENYDPILGNSYAPWHDNYRSITSVVIEDGVTAIGDYAFRDCLNITSVEISDSVTSIGKGAFGRVTGLESIELPSQLTTIGNDAFNSCTGLVSLTIPDSVTAIGDSAFGYCEGLTTVSIGAGLKDLNYGVFEGCCSLTAVTIPDNVESIGERAFSYCSALKTVCIGNGVKTIANYAFEEAALEEVTFLGDAPEFEFEYNEWTLEATPFAYVTATCYYPADNSTWTSDVMQNYGGTLTWEAVSANEGVTWTLENGVLTISGTGPMEDYSRDSWGWDAPWSSSSEDITSVVITDGVTSIGDYAFGCCYNMTSVTIANTVKSIGDYAFYEKYNLASVTIPDSVTTIGEYAFNSTGLKTVELGSGVTSIGDWCFNGCNDLEEIVVSTENKTYSVDEYGVLYQDGTYVVLCPRAIDLTSYEIPDGVTTIGIAAFLYCETLTSITFPNSLTAINAYAFNCSGLISADIPEGVKTIGTSAFSSCSNLASATLPSSLETLGDYAFAYNNNLTAVTFSGNASAIGESTFSGVTASVYYPANNDTWTSDVMQQYGGTLTWTAIEMGDDGEEEPDNSCGENLTWTLENGVLTISGTGAMYDYTWEENAPWYGCDITQVVIEDGVTTIGNYAFYNTSITEITISDSVTSIGASAFSNCYKLGVVTIPASVTSIGEYAFNDGCGGVWFEGDAPEIGDSAFYMWYGQTAYYPEGNTTWTSVVTNDYGAMRSPWKAYGDVEAPVVSELTIEDEICSGFTKITVDATDDTGVVRIQLTYALQGGTPVVIGTMTESGTYTWDVSDLADGRYTITAVAYDDAGNASTPGEITAIVDNVKPVLSTLHAVNSDGGTLFGGKYDTIYLSASGTNLGSDVTVAVSYLVYDDGVEREGYLTFAAGETGTISISDSEWEDGTYSVSALLYDVAGNYSNSASVDIAVDNTAPAAPTELSAIASALKNTLSWNRSTELNTKHYVYRAESETGERTQLTVVNSNNINLSYVDTAVTAGTTYYYWVTAQDAVGNESVAVGPVSVSTLADTTAPWIAAINPVNGATLAGKASITITAEDDIEVKSIKLECSADGADWTEIGTIAATSGTFEVDTVPYGEKMYLRITVLDAFSNEYVNSETYVYSVDNTPPEQVTGLTAVAAATAVTLNWNDVAAQDFGSFVVEQKQSDGMYKQIKTVSDALGVYVTGLTPGTEYTFRVYARDQLGNAGEPSAECTVTTLADTTAPVITNILPNPGRYNGNTTIPLVFTVADDNGVESLLVEVSYDGIDWTEAGTVSLNKTGTSVQGSYALSTLSFDEGVLYVRAVATDLYGNVSDSGESAPYTQYAIDRTAPATPTGLTAAAGQGIIRLSWDQGSESDLSTYTVYRSEEADGEFTAIASGLKLLYLVDSDVTVGTTYYYCIDVIDQVGNRSEVSETVSAVPSADVTAPQIVSVSPSNGYVMGPSTTIQVKVSDNELVAKLYYQVSADEGVTWTTEAFVTVNTDEQVVSLPLVQKDLTDAFQVKLWCVDGADNATDEVIRSYDLDCTAPAAPAITVTADNMAIQLSWIGGSEDDLSGYRVYRAVEGGSYQLLFQRSGGQSSYSYTDSNVDVNSSYSYYVEAIDTCGNTAVGTASESVYPIDKDVAAPTAVLDGATSGATGYEIGFTASRSVDNVGVVSYLWDLGDGNTANTAAVNHAFDEAGTYTVTVTVYDAAGNSDTDSMTVTIRNPASVGSLTIQVKDESGQKVPNAGIYMDLGGENQSLYYTDSTGVATLRPTSGTHVIGVYTDGYLPAKTTVDVVAGRSETITVNVVKKDIVVGELTVERMTLQQIKDAGIDVTDPANQFVYEFNIKLTYGTYEEYVSAQYNGEGETLKNPEPVKVVDNNGETRYLSINVIPVRGGGGGGGSDDGTDTEGGGGGVGPNTGEQEVPMVVIMDIPGKASWLKDFFDVRLTVINQADSEFVLDDCLAYLNVPNGLTLMDTIYTKAEASYDMGSIVGGQSETAHWVLRGDKGGEYSLTADFSAILREFGTKISARFQTDEPFRVRQGDGLTLDLVIENSIMADTDGAIKVGLRNDDEFPYYLPDITLDPEKVTLVDTYKTNGRVKVDTDRDILSTGETIWWEYIVPRDNWETLTTYSGENFYLMDAIVEATGGNAVLPYTVQEVMPFSINGDRIVVTRVSSGGGEADVSYLNVDKANLFSAVIPDLMIRTYRENDQGEYEPTSMEITIKDGYIIGKGEDADGNEVGEEGITVTTNSNGEYTYKGYSMVMVDNDKSFNIRISASRANPVDIPVVIRGESAETGMLKVYVYTGSDDKTTVLEGATVTIREVNGVGTEDLTDSTDEEGLAEFKKVPQGKQELLIEKDGYLPLNAVVDVGSDTEVSYRLYTDDDPSASRIIQIKNDLSGWGSGNQTIFPEGRVTGTVYFQLTKRIAEGETFEQYHYRIKNQEGAMVEEGAFTTDSGFWLELDDLKAGNKLEFAVETDKGISAYMDSNIIVTSDPGFFGDLIYDLKTIQIAGTELGGKVDFTKGLEFDPSEFIKDFTIVDIVEGVSVKDDEKGYQAEAIEHTNVYSFTKEESKRIYPVSAQYDLSGKLTLSVILGSEKETSTTTGGSYSAAAYIETPDYVAYQGVVAVADEKVSDKKKVSGQLQADFVFQYDPTQNDWSLTVYGKISAEQSFTLMEATFLKVGYVSADLKFEESATLEVAKTKAGPEQKIEVLGSGLVPTEMKASGELKTSVGAKAVSKKVASVGAYMKVGLEFQLLPYLALRANAALGAEGSVLIWSKSKDLVSNTWELSGDAEPAALATFALYDLRSSTVDTLSLAAPAAQAALMVEDAWIAGAYEQAEPQLVTLSDGSILAAWCGYTGDEAAPVALYWSLYENGTWSEPSQVETDGTADLYPSMIVTDESVQLVWVDFTGSVAEMDNLTYAEIQDQAFQMLGVTTASFSNGSWIVVDAYEGGTLAANPKVAVGADGSVLVSWIANDGNLEEATAEYPDYVSWILLDGEGVVLDSGNIAAPAVTIIDLGVGYDSENGYQLTVLADDADGMLKLFHSEMQDDTWTQLSSVSGIASEDSAMAMAANGVTYTVNSGRIYAYEDGVYRHLLRSDLLTEDAGDLTCVETAQGTVLIWTATLGADSAVCMVLVDASGKVSQPLIVNCVSDGILTAPTATATDSELIVMYQHAAAVDGLWNHDVLTQSFAMGVDLSLENSLIRHSGYLIPGAYLESYVEVENLGVAIPDSFSVEVYSVDADGNETVIAEEEGGSSLNLTLKWIVPEDYAGETMYFRVVTDGVSDCDSTNNEVELGNLIRELAVSNPVYVGRVDGEDVFTIDVENQGLVTSAETTLTVKVIGSEDDALLTTSVEELEPGAKRTIRLTLTDLDHAEELPLAFVVDPLAGEGDLSNNNEYLILPARPSYLANVTVNDVTTPYTTLEKAVENASDGSTVSLLSDVTLTETLTIAADRDFTLDLSGFTVYSELVDTDEALIDVQGALTVTNGTIEGSLLVSGALDISGALTLNSDSDVYDIKLTSEQADLDLSNCTTCEGWTVANETNTDLTVVLPANYGLTVDGMFVAAVSAGSATDVHLHNYSTQWTYDETGHWYACECGSRKEVNPHDCTTVVTGPTCVEQGYTTFTCSCGYSYVGDYVNASGHTEVIDCAVKPTSAKSGLTAGSHCSVCEIVLVEQEVEPAKGYEWMLEDGEFKILLIGNSYSQDASNCGQGMTTSQMLDILQAMLGENVNVTVGLIQNGGKSMSWHATQAEQGNAAYSFQIISTAVPTWKSQGSVSSAAALSWTDWDVVSLQPYSVNTSTGQESVPYPESTDEKFYPLEIASEYMLDHVSKHAPQSDVYLYMHWAPTKTIALNASLSTYNKMAAFFPVVLDYIGTETGEIFADIIPVGLSVQNARSTYLALLAYNTSAYDDGNLNLITDAQIGLQRDGGHLSFNIGRYIAALTFAETILPDELRANGYALPSIRITESVGKLPGEYTEIAQKAVFAAVDSWRQGSLAVTDINGYEEDPTVSVGESLSELTLELPCAASEEDLMTKIAAAILALLPEDFSVDEITLSESALTAVNFTCDVTIRFGYTSLTVKISCECASHEYESVVTAPTCAEQGYTTHTCIACGGSYEDTYVAATGEHVDVADDGDHKCDVCETADVSVHAGGEATCMTQAVCSDCSQSYGEIDPDNHTGNNTTGVNAEEATCGEAGYTGDTVCECGEVIEEGDVIPATGNHTDAADDGDHKCDVCEAADVSVHAGGEATCKDQAICSDCKQSYGDKNLANHAGGTGVRDRVEATEFENGYTGDTYCLGCGEKVVSGSVIPATHEHSYSDATCVAPATCSCGATTGEKDPTDHVGGTEVRDRVEATEFENGYTGDTYCLGCGEKVATGTIIAATHEHSYNDATCMAPATCSCGAVTGEKDPGNHTGNNATGVNAEEATCGEAGYTGDTVCECGEIIEAGDVIPATGNHTDASGDGDHKCDVCEAADVSVHTGGEATCKDQAICSDCKQSYGDKNLANHAGGTEVRGRVEATEFENGYTGDTYCLSCGEKVATGTTIPATHEHSYSDATCAAPATCSCGATTGEKDPTNHVGGTEVRDRVEATEFENGYTGDTYCLSCGEKVATGTTVPATHEHSYSDATCMVPATCSCGAITGEKDPNNHTGNNTTGVNAEEATCGEAGYTGDTVCECGKTIVQGTTIPAKGHSFTNYASDGNAACTVDGTKTAKCDRCDVTDTVVDAGSAKGHSWTTTWSSDNSHHWHICENTGCTLTEVSMMGSYGIHAYNDASDPTCNQCGYEREVGPSLDVDLELSVDKVSFDLTVTEDYTSVRFAIWATDDQAHTMRWENATYQNGAWTLSIPACAMGIITEYTIHVYAASGGAEECLMGTTVNVTEATGHTYAGATDHTCDVCSALRTIPMFRMYDPNSGEHFYTGSEEERDNLVDEGWDYEGVAFNFPAAGAPVYRLYDPVSGDHLYTMNEAEKAELLARGWNYEGVAFNSAADTEVAQYRLYNPNAHLNGTRGAWHFTSSADERDFLIGLGWQYQGVGWYSEWA